MVITDDKEKTEKSCVFPEICWLNWAVFPWPLELPLTLILLCKLAKEIPKLWKSSQILLQAFYFLMAWFCLDKGWNRTFYFYFSQVITEKDTNYSKQIKETWFLLNNLMCFTTLTELKTVFILRKKLKCKCNYRHFISAAGTSFLHKGEQAPSEEVKVWLASRACMVTLANYPSLRASRPLSTAANRS